MRYLHLRQVVSRRPVAVIVAWLLLAAGVGVAAPSLTQLAAEGQANLLPKDAESVQVNADRRAGLARAVVSIDGRGRLEAAGGADAGGRGIRPAPGRGVRERRAGRRTCSACSVRNRRRTWPGGW